jgi:hypothetical protein
MKLVYLENHTRSTTNKMTRKQLKTIKKMYIVMIIKIAYVSDIHNFLTTISYEIRY